MNVEEKKVKHVAKTVLVCSMVLYNFFYIHEKGLVKQFVGILQENALMM